MAVGSPRLAKSSDIVLEEMQSIEEDGGGGDGGEMEYKRSTSDSGLEKLRESLIDEQRNKKSSLRKSARA